MGASHRDITPGNVYVGEQGGPETGRLRHREGWTQEVGGSRRPCTLAFVPCDIGAFWRPADDVYQVGLLALTLLAGEEVTNTVRKVDVNQLASRHFGLRETTRQQAISVKAQRPQTASELAFLPR